MTDETKIDDLLTVYASGERNSLGFMKPPAETRVVVAMSGGVDSSVTAALLHEQGYEVIGITLQLYDHGVAIEKAGACCAGQDIQDARRVSESLGIPHYVLDYENRFRDAVMEDFADSYIRGETPIPCVTCNQTVKFRDLVATARDLGADCLATGHYIRRVVGDAGPELHVGIDPAKDQSYFLFATTADQLDFLRFPLGGLRKPAVRALAARYGLAVADKPDSQDICFVPGGDYASVIERLRPGAAEAGDIVDLDGKVLGTHKGIIHFTIGQRRGLGIGGTVAPLYVVALRPKTREVVVGPHEALLMKGIRLDGLNWLAAPVAAEGAGVSIKIRSTRGAAPARLYMEEGGRAHAIFETPEAGVSPGQAGVIYAGERLLGGGWIRAAIPGDERLTKAQ